MRKTTNSTYIQVLAWKTEKCLGDNRKHAMEINGNENIFDIILLKRILDTALLKFISCIFQALFAEIRNKVLVDAPDIYLYRLYYLSTSI